MHCNNPLSKKWQKMFCSRSCAGSFNNKGRIHTQESKQKVANTLKQFVVDNPGFYAYHPHKIKSWTVNRVKCIQKNVKCTYCGNDFVSTRSISNHFPRLCSDTCFLNMKRRNARGNKTLIYDNHKFDSQWEVEIAIMLDSLNIKWIQPIDPIPWSDSKGKLRKYYPDFYLTDYNIYLDPKNPIVISQQQEKLNAVKDKIPLIYGHLTLIKNYITKLVAPPEFESGILRS